MADAKATAGQIGSDQVYAWIAEAQAKAGDVPGATATADQMSDKNRRDKDGVYARIAARQLEGGDVAGAKQTASRIRDAHDRAFAYGQIAASQVSAGDPTGAHVTAAQIDQRNRNVVMRAIALAEISSGNAAGAEHLAETMTDAHQRLQHLLIASRRLCEPRRPEPLPGPRGKVFYSE